jgi:hypothetical protein
MDKHLKRFAMTALSVAIFAFIVYIVLLRSSGYASVSGEDSDTSSIQEADWTVYGSMNCGWTVKQLKEMDSKNVSYTFIDCDKQDCPGVKGFPTLKGSDGTVKTGYTPM